MTSIQDQEIESQSNVECQKPKRPENLIEQENDVKTNALSSESASTLDDPKVKEEWNNYVKEHLELLTSLTQNYNAIASSYLENWIKVHSSFYESSKTFHDLFFRSLFANLRFSSKTDYSKING